MKIWIDGYEANVLQRLGSSQVAFKLLLSLEKEDHKNDYTILLPAPPLEDLPKERSGWKYKILKPKRLWTKIALPLALFTSKEKPDIFFSPTHYIPRFAPSRVKRVVTIFDLSFLRFPEMFTKKDLWQLKNWTKFSVENCDHIITISKCSKEDIIKSYGLNEDKITVAYPGYDREKFTGNRQQATDKNYLIYIGTLQPRKNLVRLMEAFARVVKDVKDLELVIVGKTTGEGKQGWLYDEILKTPAELGIQE
ncbi:glycosyltransferase family 4 protein, partial [Candidatus Daviesbacteria bacterium]|nr:glycosyltransferase family 4 protein [Candidatus Daviesbacteria bacterium]